jgi:hypothetical protein
MVENDCCAAIGVDFGSDWITDFDRASQHFSVVDDHFTNFLRVYNGKRTIIGFDNADIPYLAATLSSIG